MTEAIQGTTKAQAAKVEALIKLEVLTMSRKLFTQIIRQPLIHVDKDKAAVQAQNEGQAIVIQPGDFGDTLCLICRDANGLYRWMIGGADFLAHLPPDMLWLQDLPQVFIK